jgi:predicted house-cleaning noncanonical NTP pyrophosphatase (MazG superfamily)
MPTDSEDEIQQRAQTIARDLLQSIERDSGGQKDMVHVAVGALLGRTAKLEALLEKMSEIVQQQARAVLALTVEVSSHSETIDAMLGEELKRRRVQH